MKKMNQWVPYELQSYFKLPTKVRIAGRNAPPHPPPHQIATLVFLHASVNTFTRVLTKCNFRENLAKQEYFQ